MARPHAGLKSWAVPHFGRELPRITANRRGAVVVAVVMLVVPVVAPPLAVSPPPPQSLSPSDGVAGGGLGMMGFGFIVF